DSRLDYESRDLSAPGSFSTGIVLKMNPAGTPVFATRFGGDHTTPTAIAVDGTGAIVVAGSSNSEGFQVVLPISTPRYTYGDGSCTNPFVAKIDPSGTQFLFSTLLGSADQLSFLTSLALDGAGDIVVSGATRATDFPVRDAYQAQKAGGVDYFFTRLTRN